MGYRADGGPYLRRLLGGKVPRSSRLTPGRYGRLPLEDGAPFYVTAPSPTVSRDGRGDADRAYFAQPKYINWAAFVIRGGRMCAQSHIRARYFI